MSLLNNVVGLMRATNAGSVYTGTAPTVEPTYDSSASSLVSADAKYNAEQAQLARDWQKEFAQNSYQWAVEDLKKAGLNPILAATGLSAGTTSAPSAAYSGGATYASAKETSGATVKSSEITAKATILSSAIKVLGQIVSTGISSLSGMITKGIPSTSTTTSYNYLYK